MKKKLKNKLKKIVISVFIGFPKQFYKFMLIDKFK
jgi:hypothetical protein